MKFDISSAARSSLDGETDSATQDSSRASHSSGQSNRREDTFESDEGLIVTIRDEYDEAAAAEVEHKRCLRIPHDQDQDLGQEGETSAAAAKRSGVIDQFSVLQFILLILQ